MANPLRSFFKLFRRNAEDSLKVAAEQTIEDQYGMNPEEIKQNVKKLKAMEDVLKGKDIEDDVALLILDAVAKRQVQSTKDPVKTVFYNSLITSIEEYQG